MSVLSNVLQEQYLDIWARLNQQGEGTGDLIHKLEDYLSNLLSALELSNSPQPYNVISDNIGKKFVKCCNCPILYWFNMGCVKVPVVFTQ